VEGPAKYLAEFRASPVPIFDNQVSVNLPAIMRPTQIGKTSVEFVLTSLGADHPEAVMQVQSIPFDSSVEPQKVCETVAATMGAKLKPDAPWKFDQLADHESTFVAPAVACAPEPEHKVQLAMGIVFGKKQAVLVVYTVLSKDADEQKAYQETFQKIVANVKIRDSK
jgi:hypothetical protein